MSKAFTKDDDDAPTVALRRQGVALPHGPNYVTAAGSAALHAELAASTDPERTRELAEHLATAIVVDHPVDPHRVGFGARVTVADDDRACATYRVVGAIEAVPRAGAISFESPLARALLGATVGEVVTSPRGTELEIVAIEY